MKKKCLFILLLMSLLFTSCDLDGNFGIKTLYCTYLAVNDIQNSEVTLFCKSEKIGISSLCECTEITDNETINDLKKEILINDNSDFKLFRIPSISDINDRNNISISFEAKVDSEIYRGNLYIKRLKENSSGYLFKESVILKTEDGKEISSVFAYAFWRSI